jgi:hypothetical protein
MFQILVQGLYATDTYGDYAMKGSWSDGDGYGSAIYDGQGSGDDFYGVRLLNCVSLCTRLSWRTNILLFCS